MCNTDYYPPAICETSDRKAAKEHKCSECRRVIAKGESYRLIDHLFQGEWWHTKVCAHCQVGMRWLTKECGGFPIGAANQDVCDHAAEYHSAPLWRLVVGANRKWARFDGAGLMSIPKMPPVDGEAAKYL